MLTFRWRGRAPRGRLLRIEGVLLVNKATEQLEAKVKGTGFSL